MKTNHSRIAFFLLAPLLLFFGCKQQNASPEVTTETTDVSPSASSNKGQAFIEDEGATPNALRLAINSPDHTTLVAAV